jgi:hypothetical protein
MGGDEEMNDLDQAIEEARECVAEIVAYEKLTAPKAWRLADLTAENTYRLGDTVDQNGLPMAKWADQIGWTKAGRNVKSLQKMVAEARAWPAELRVAEAPFWSHYEARAKLKDVQQASAWLAERVKNGKGAAPSRPRVLTSEAIIDAIGNLSHEETVEVALAAHEAIEAEGETRKKRQRAVREEQQEDPNSAHYRIVLLDIAKATDQLLAASKQARDASFTPERKLRLANRLAIHEDALAFLRLAIEGVGDVDWDEEFARLQEAGTTEGG